MGGGNVGKANITVGLDLSQAKQELTQFGKGFGKTASGIFLPVKDAAEQVTKAINAQAAAEKKAAEQRKIADEAAIARQKQLAAKKAAEVFTIPKRGAEEIARLTTELNKAEKAFAATGRQSQSLGNYIESLRNQINAVRAAFSQGLLPVSKIQAEAKEVAALRARLRELENAKFLPGSKQGIEAAKEIDRTKDALERLGAASDRNLNFIQRHAVAINQLAFSAARAGSGFANFLPLIARSTTLLANMGAKAGGGGGGAAGAMTALRGAASGAAGALGAAGIAAIGAATAILAVIAVIGVLTAKLGPLGSALTKAQNSIKLIFAGASEDVLNFSKKASTAFGITEQAALRFVGKTGQLFKSFEIGTQAAGQMSKGLLVAADVLRSTSTEFIASEEAMQAVFDTVAGNVEGLRRFDIFLSEIGLSQIALQEGLKVTTGAFDNFQRSQISGLATVREAQRRFQQYINTMDSTQRITERTRAAWDSFKATLGQGFAPLLAFILHMFLGIVTALKEWIGAAKSFGKDHEGFIRALVKIQDLLKTWVPSFNIAGKVLGFFKRKGEEAGEEALTFEERMAALEESALKFIDTFNKYKKVLTVTELEQLVDAHNRLKDAIDDAARAEKQAMRDLTRAQEDAVRDREKAQLALVEAIEDAEEKLFEARKKVKDTEKKNFRDIRDAERALKRERIESARRVDAAEKALSDARQKRQDAILNAQLSLAQALLQGNIVEADRARLELTRARRSDDLKNAQKKLNEEEFDSKEKLKLLEEKLLETRLDAIEALKEAERELQNVIEENAEAILEARRNLHDVEVDISRKLFDSVEALKTARREGKEAVAEADEALDRLNWQFGTMDQTLAQILDKLERMKNGLIGLEPLLGTFGRKKGSGTSPGGFHEGGMAPRGKLAVVGEKGPELIIPNSNSTVISNEQLARVMHGTSNGGVKQYVTVNQVANDPDATAFAVSARLGARLN